MCSPVFVLEVTIIKQVYIASPLRGDYEKNIKNAVEYCRLASEAGVLPLAPHIIFSQWCNDTVPEQREQGLKLGLSLLAHCEELWVMGTQFSQGMQGEVEFAQKNDIPYYIVSHPFDAEYYPISRDENRLLTALDCIPDSRKENYEGKLVVLRHEKLRVEHRNSRNQLWLVTHGPGCRPDYKFSDTIHLLHPIDKDHMAIERGEVWGVPTNETVERLQAAYPDFAFQQAAKEQQDEELCL